MTVALGIEKVAHGRGVRPDRRVWRAIAVTSGGVTACTHDHPNGAEAWRCANRQARRPGVACDE